MRRFGEPGKQGVAAVVDVKADVELGARRLRDNVVRGIASGRSLLMDADFRMSASPPFGWTLANGGGGIAESGDGGLHVVSYGRDSFVAAFQIMRLPPGTYTLTQAKAPAP